LRNFKLILIPLSVFSLTACGSLMTRSDLREAEQKRQMQDQVVTLQRSTADVNNRFSDIEADLRSMNGRIEVLENRNNQLIQDRERTRGQLEQAGVDQNKKIQILSDEVVRLNEQINAFAAELTAIKSASLESRADRPSEGKKDAFETAEYLFEKKDWRKAILNYQRFRDSHPKHRNFPEATYKIGVSFQELGMKDEARTFYEEVIGKFPNSPEAKKARTRVKTLKK
jgi:TolA-binding protein